ncbi:alanine/glycine:cation symporter family protein [Sphingobacterium psychroaquaticum]|uniref:Alanine or glycine:cation symporter, AGCS family n=1 Tax=Sphingobacterium psychroaquaticum TaxID=561061 RepID=A0A1X7JRE8_9SPHI|nr:alanine/glycine:cation symporter family protein [Sphingobacterium psychroaquaticum]SMG30659.1 alanine or glycine:cation symporter, AGCS family [Sphingobacterium psychroaquaticum]
MESTIKAISNIVWSDFFIYLCLFTGLYFSIRTGFLQVRYVREMLRLLFVKRESDKGISSFQAFALAISGRVGTGNIVGVATAIYMGGPGAVFWMWAIAFLGSASAFVEATLGQLYKQVIDGEYRGGPAYYIEKGLGVKWYAVLFAVVTIVSTGLLLPGVQSNAINGTISNAFDYQNSIVPFLGIEFPLSIVGLAIIVLLAVIIIGGVKRLGQASEFIVPFMAGAYILMAIVIIGLNFSEIPAVFKLIFSSAFSLDASFGGIVGMAIAWGVKRGIYSNEAGQGTAPHAAAAADVRHPAQQGLVQAFSVYVDTLFVCTATALMILFTNMFNTAETFDKSGKAQTYIVNNVPNIEADGFTQAAIASHFPAIGHQFVAVALFFFAFTTIMAYYYYAETNVTYIFKGRFLKPVIWLLRISFLGATYLGTVKTANQAWDLGDIGVGLMAWVNLIAILLLSKTAMKVWKDYKNKRKAGIKDPTFSAKEIGIKNADFWD